MAKKRHKPRAGEVWRVRKNAKIRWIRLPCGTLAAVFYGSVHRKNRLTGQPNPR